jgi:molybdate transport repressor ModE-like protein
MTKEDEALAKLRPNWKLWLEFDGEYVFGPGAFAILKHIHEEGTLTRVKDSTGMSYRYAWGVIKKIEEVIGVKLIETFKGGPSGGGGANVTKFGLKLMDMFATVQDGFEQASRWDDS